jgi:hypothetical protein
MKRILILSFLASACSLAPLQSGETGRSLGEKHAHLDAGATGVSGSNGIAVNAKFAYGISQNFDVGIQYDFIGMGILAKYSLINHQDKGFSLATLGGAGTDIFGFGSSYIYIGPAVSYLMDWWEPYIVARFNQVTIGAFSSNSIKVTERTTFNYLQGSVGSFFWFTKTFGLGLEYNTFFNSEQIQFSGSGLFSARLALRF